MREARSTKYGRFLAYFINNFIESVPENRSYKERFLREVLTYSDKPRKRGEKRNEGCNNKLKTIENFNSLNPEYLARLIKEGLHLMYQKQTSKRVLEKFIEELER